MNLNLIVDGPGSSSAFDVHNVPICVQSRLETVSSRETVYKDCSMQVIQVTLLLHKFTVNKMYPIGAIQNQYSWDFKIRIHRWL